jgi:hypothetical protein
LPAAAPAFELLLWSTSPDFPGLKIRTGMLVFFGWTCSDSASASASWSFLAFWPIAWMPPLPQHLPSPSSPDSCS